MSGRRRRHISGQVAVFPHRRSATGAHSFDPYPRAAGWDRRCADLRAREWSRYWTASVRILPDEPPRAQASRCAVACSPAYGTGWPVWTRQATRARPSPPGWTAAPARRQRSCAGWWRMRPRSTSGRVAGSIHRMSRPGFSVSRGPIPKRGAECVPGSPSASCCWGAGADRTLLLLCRWPRRRVSSTAGWDAGTTS